jgi:hypothetical protein
LHRRFDAGLIWKLEPQMRGAPHYHMLVWCDDEQSFCEWVPYSWFEIAGNGDDSHLSFHLGFLQGSTHCVSKVRSFRGVWSYASKYLGKTFDVAGWGDLFPGRFWAVVNRSLIPFGELSFVDISTRQAVHIMRYQKRFAKLRRRSYPSLTTLCDADQWFRNVIQEEVQT